jgi:predicted RNA-binding Zn-ribbon protein involved in translation (DUF1610 family)
MSLISSKRKQMPNELDREAHIEQTHCYTCGKPFERVKYECPTCGEWSCSDECRQKHIETLDAI